jgi:hypothetical protein
MQLLSQCSLPDHISVFSILRFVCPVVNHEKRFSKSRQRTRFGASVVVHVDVVVARGGAVGGHVCFDVGVNLIG